VGIAALRHGVELARAKGPIEAARHLLHWASDRGHERRFRVSTAVPIGLEVLGFGDPRRIDYAAPTYRTLRRALSFFDVRRESVFLDYGCGRGRALVAASTLGFAKVIGVEIVPELLAEATANLERATPRLRCRNHELIHADAMEYVPPGEVDSIYFFNPFRGEVLAAAIRNVETSLRRSPRPLTIVYLNADQFSTMAKRLPWLELTHEFVAYPETYTAVYRARP
jgi:SAM-dependent methyltransferase